MDLLMNGLLFAATLFAGGYCWVLSRRVRDLKSLDKGLGGSIVTLTRQIELARLTLEEARAATKERRQDLAQLVARAEAATGQLRMLLAVMPPATAATAMRAPEPATTDEATPEPVTAPEPELRARRDLQPAPSPAPTPAPSAAPEAPVAPLLRAVPDAPTATPEAAPVAPEAAPVVEVPKPRTFAPVENPLRRAKGASATTAPATPADEDDILEALSALAGAGAR